MVTLLYHLCLRVPHCSGQQQNLPVTIPLMSNLPIPVLPPSLCYKFFPEEHSLNKSRGLNLSPALFLENPT